MNDWRLAALQRRMPSPSGTWSKVERAMANMTGDVADALHHAPPGHRSGIPAAQEPGPLAGIRACVRDGPCVLPGGVRRKVYGGPVVGHRPGRPRAKPA